MAKYTKGLVSLILPIYNVEKYLSACIDACLSQTYENIEIILVDDGAKDSSPVICDEYAKKDNRIIVIHQENAGLSEARNSGIKIAKGEWIAFIDSDDIVSDRYVELMIEAAVREKASMVWCKIAEVDDDGKYITDDLSLIDDKKPYEEYELRHFNKSEAEMQFYNMWGMQIALVAWNKLYHKSLFADDNGEKIFYAKGKIFEDGFTTYKYIYQADKIVYIDAPLYLYRQRAGSIMKENRIVNFDPALEAGVERLEFYKDKGEREVYMLELNYTIYSPIRFYEQVSDKSRKKELMKWFEKIYYGYFIKEKWPKAKRIRMWAFLKCYPLYKVLSAFQGVYNTLAGKK